MNPLVERPSHSLLVALAVVKHCQPLLIDQIELFVALLCPFRFFELELGKNPHGGDLHFDWQNNFHTVDQGVRGHPVRRTDRHPICQERKQEHLVPVLIIHHHFFDVLVHSFCHNVHFGTVRRGVTMLNLELCTEFIDDFVVEVLGIVSNDGARTPYRVMMSCLMKQTTGIAAIDASVTASIYLVK
ncbi:hypothetical protein CRG98_022859 [Punica granatum]|uniref:Uncharacterized protein n=1 Tax=Punica granatum TaxID=22663 RepID=A0A2I0JKE7_PUNGR|nr:hypothetical protein CRG98_022859 [Punica granatum]